MKPSEFVQFCVAVKNLREAMENDLSLNDFERISLDNHLALLHMTYVEWKQRNVPSAAFKSAA
jgi:hypothetical protein